MKKYNIEKFLNNFKEDSEYFGFDTAKVIYEDVFSAVARNKVTLDGIDKLLEELKILSEDGVSLETPEDAQRKGVIDLANSVYWRQKTEQAAKDFPIKPAEIPTEIPNDIPTNDKASVLAGLSIFKSGILGKIASWLTKMPAKISKLFGDLTSGKTSFSEVLSNGFKAIAADPTKALMTTGGLAAVILLLRSLKKKGELNKYAQLTAMANKRKLYEDVDVSPLSQLLEECENNVALKNALFKDEEEVNKTVNYFCY